MPRISPVATPQPETPLAVTLDQMKARLGRVPNAYATLAQSPATVQGYLAFSAALRKGRLTARQRESLALAISQANECQYCLSAHTVTGKMAGLTPDQIRKARAGKSDDPLEHAIADFAIKAMQRLGMVSDDDLKEARAAGVDEA